jgi:hypothetical protein
MDADRDSRRRDLGSARIGPAPALLSGVRFDEVENYLGPVGVLRRAVLLGFFLAIGYRLLWIAIAWASPLAFGLLLMAIPPRA